MIQPLAFTSYVMVQPFFALSTLNKSKLRNSAKHEHVYNLVSKIIYIDVPEDCSKWYQGSECEWDMSAKQTCSPFPH